jgi:D-xylonolactonase
MANSPTIIAKSNCVCGENPIWHADEKLLYWVDIPNGRLFGYDPRNGDYQTLKQGRHLGAMTIQADGSLLLMGGEGCYVSIWKDGEETPVIESIEGETRFNDAIADRHGRVFSGSMPHPGWKEDADKTGKLYRIDTDGSYQIMDTGFGCANGMGFTADGKTFFFTDTPTGNIYAYDYDEQTGDLSNRRAQIHISDDPGMPDGMTVDADGHIWSAKWGGSQVVQYNLDGEKLQSIDLPTANITSIAFGGDDLETMYITSAGGNHPDAPEDENAAAGALFEFEAPGVKGVEEFRSKIGL